MASAASGVAPPRTLNCGLVGAGVVGGGVMQILAARNSSVFKGQLGVDLVIKKIAVRDVAKARSFELPAGTSVVGDVQEILGDAEIDCVVEVMGGVGLAKTVVLGAIAADKHVVTANKALVASCLGEIEAALAAHPSVKFCYEAAVCGGIPIINALQSAYLGDRITSVTGIMNGTTNYMLTKMESEGAAYGEVLAEAQALGFAEADPTADVEGHDVQAKIALLAKLAFGRSVSVESVGGSGCECPCAGISSVDSVDFAFAKALGATIKLLGTAKLSSGSSDGSEGSSSSSSSSGSRSLAVYVSPTVVPLSHPVARAPGATNVVHVSSDNLASSTLVGPGAGALPTANSVVADLLRVGSGTALAPFPTSDPSLPIDSDFASKFYVRVGVKADDKSVVASIGASAQAASCSVASLLPSPGEGREGAEVKQVAITTGVCLRSQIDDMCKLVAAQPFAVGTPVVMTLL